MATKKELIEDAEYAQRVLLAVAENEAAMAVLETAKMPDSDWDIASAVENALR